MIPLEYLTPINFSGADAGEFLHNQLSADVAGLSDGESAFACYCEPKGRVLALMLVCRVEEAYYVIMSSALATTVCTRLKMYVMRSNVSIDWMDEFTVFAHPGTDEPGSISGKAVAIPVPGSDSSRLVIGDEPESIPDTNSLHDWKAAELERGICWLSPETSAQFLPQMLGFDELGAVNFRKGCYPGQEIVARTRYLGKVKRHPRLLYANIETPPGLLEKIKIMSGEQEYDAVVVDSVPGKDSRWAVFVVTRMDPDLVADRIGCQGILVSLD